MRRKDIAERMVKMASKHGEPFGKQPLLELFGEHRVLIEHHKGIGEYSTEKLQIKVGYGSIVLMGTGLEICQMSEDQLVVTGTIATITLCKEVL